MPGGKPAAHENALSAVIRETVEETGIDITPYANDVRFFGEYTIDDPETNIHPSRYRKVRAWLRLPLAARDLPISTRGEAHSQHSEDAVRFVQSVPVKHIVDYIPWFEKADEHKALRRNKIINDTKQK